MTSRISYNIHAQRVLDRNKLLTHLAKIKPAAVLVMDGLQLCREIKAMLPQTTVISRIYPDDDIQNKKSPEQWYQERAAQAEGGIFQYTGNEGGFSPKMIDWHIRLMELCITGRVPLVIGNMSVGTPAAEDWAAGRRLLELLDQYRNLFILGLHEYACGVITSGFLGGYPDNAGVAPNSGQKGRNLIPSANWPSRAEAAMMTMFHCGRFKFAVNYCNSIGIKPPRIILTEHGFDDVSDIKGWSEKLQMTPPYTGIRGWKSCQNQWKAWYGAQGWTPQRAMFEQLVYADRTIYQGSPVEAQLIFCWGHTSDMWDQFDVAGADEFQGLLEGYATSAHDPVGSQPPTIPTYPKLPEATDPRWTKVVAIPKSGNVNVRDVPDKTGTIVAVVHPTDELYIITSESQGIWMPVKLLGSGLLRGWVSTDVIGFQDVPITIPSKDIALSRADCEELHLLYQGLADKYAEFLNR